MWTKNSLKKFFYFFMIFMDEDKKKKSEPLGFVIFLKKRTKKEHTATVYKKCD